MSASKIEARSQNYKDAESAVRKLIVEMVDSSFHVARQSDDMGTHLMVYLPDDQREEFSTKKFRDEVKQLGRVRVLLSFVASSYIDFFLRQ